MDFIIGLPLMARRHDSMFVVVDTLTRSAHFSGAYDVSGTWHSESFHQWDCEAAWYAWEEFIWSRINVYWTISNSFQEALGTQLNFSTTYHLETDGQTERTNQTLEDMLCMYVMDQQKHWEELFPLVEFAYNNNYQSTIKMTPFEFLYRRPFQTPLSWYRLEDRVLVGP